MKRIFSYLLVSLCTVLFTACASITPDQPALVVTAQRTEATPSTFSLQPPLPFVELKRTESVPQAVLVQNPFLDPKELQCLVENMYHEAQGEPERGKIAVGYVVMNRVKDGGYANTICGVVKQGKYAHNRPVLHQCQFSWWCDGLSDSMKNTALVIELQALARQIVLGTVYNPIGNSLCFHNVHVHPKWSKRYVTHQRIGNHIFYA